MRLEFNHRKRYVLESEQVRLKSEQKLKACQEKLKLERINQVWFERSKAQIDINFHWPSPKYRLDVS